MHSKERDTNVQVQDKTLSGQNHQVKKSLVKTVISETHRQTDGD